MADPTRASRRLRELRRLGLGLVWLCLIQYLLGMQLNLFVAIPRHHPGSSGSDYFSRALQSVLWGISHGGLLAFHVGLGIVLLLGSLRLALAAFQAPPRGLRAIAVLGVLAVLAASFNGASFLSYHEDLSSMIMASSFAVAVFCFSWVVFRATTTVPQGAVASA
ncbi:MAG: hypothetical protein WCB86_02020 [Candidatus Dormiibacterota bacterium]